MGDAAASHDQRPGIEWALLFVFFISDNDLDNAMIQATRSDAASYKATLDEYGFILLKNLISRETALYMASRLIDIFESQPDVVEADQHISSVFDHLTPDDYELFQETLTHPICLDLARRTLGEDFQLAEPGARRFKPGAHGLPVHVGEPAARLKELGIRIPETCFALTFSWMLNDLNEDNGVRLLMPFSHHFGHAPRDHLEYPHLAQVEAPAGSILLFNSATWHGVAPNRSRDGDRIELACEYYMSWLDPREIGWKPLKRSVRDRMSDVFQRLNKRVDEG